MKNTNLDLKLLSLNAHIGQDFLDDVKKTTGHIIVSWTDEMQVENKDLIFYALTLDEHNLNRIHEGFYEKYVDEMINIMNEHNYYLFPEQSFKASEKYLKKYFSFFLKGHQSIEDTFSFRYIDSIKKLVCEDENLLLYLSAACQQEIISSIIKVVKKNPKAIQYVKNDVLYHNYLIAETCVSQDPKCFYYLPSNYAGRYETILCYLDKEILCDIAINGIHNHGESESYYPTVSRLRILAKLLNITPYAIAFANSKQLLFMRKEKLSERLSDKDVREVFIKRRPIISKIKNVKP